MITQARQQIFVIELRFIYSVKSTGYFTANRTVILVQNIKNNNDIEMIFSTDLHCFAEYVIGNREILEHRNVVCDNMYC